jgi:hypothetical protein
LHARFRAGGLAQREPRLDAGALVAAAAGGVKCVERDRNKGDVEGEGGQREAIASEDGISEQFTREVSTWGGGRVRRIVDDARAKLGERG